MRAYYEKRKPYMVKIWCLMIGAKIGNIAEVLRVLFLPREETNNDLVFS